MNRSRLTETGWFGFVPRRLTTPRFPGFCWLFWRVSWCRGHLRDPIIAALET